ncbi:hypothetical protein EI982_16840 [Haloplanus rallus]|uniref:Uncharacterized protein n=1 Tax=Haloplanus rallus TaxID=1816183 RepID=A0A6B9F889_9EURY|nr:hypothetical protein EI982_16840 [Haloplanus rallus]
MDSVLEYSDYFAELVHTRTMIEAGMRAEVELRAAAVCALTDVYRFL